MRSKIIDLSVLKWYFSPNLDFFSDKVDLGKPFLEKKIKTFSGKANQSLQNSVNPNLLIGNILANNFEANLRLKTNALRVQKNHFLLFC